jgi:hypothetical protein
VENSPPSPRTADCSVAAVFGGWDVQEKPNTPIEHATPRVHARPAAIVTAPPPVVHARVLPFSRAAAQ